MKLKTNTTLLLSFLIVAVGIAVTVITGLWQTKSDQIPRVLEPEKLATVAADTVDTEAVVYDPADIRGSYTFGRVSSLYGIPQAAIAEAFGIPEADVEAFQVKSLETLYDEELEIGTASVRLFTACYLGLPYTPSEESYLPKSAVDILVANGNMTAEQAAFVAAHTAP